MEARDRLPGRGAVDSHFAFGIRRAYYVADRSRNENGVHRSVSDNKENIPPESSRSRRRRARHKKSPLPSWYPRTPLRDVTAIVAAMERRRVRLRNAAEMRRRTQEALNSPRTPVRVTSPSAQVPSVSEEAPQTIQATQEPSVIEETPQTFQAAQEPSVYEETSQTFQAAQEPSVSEETPQTFRAALEPNGSEETPQTFQAAQESSVSEEIPQTIQVSVCNNLEILEDSIPVESSPQHAKDPTNEAPLVPIISTNDLSHISVQKKLSDFKEIQKVERDCSKASKKTQNQPNRQSKRSTLMSMR